ncbi:MAG: hypothetical protein IJA55_03010 [Clostridia bacterium]|nr:hypothetical protein [Clostridia bacterium]
MEYKDSNELSEECNINIENLYNHAVSLMNSDDYNDYKKAADIFHEMSDWKYSSEYEIHASERYKYFSDKEANERTHRNIVAEIESLESVAAHIQTRRKNVGWPTGLCLIFVGIICVVPFIIRQNLAHPFILFSGVFLIIFGIGYSFKKDGSKETLEKNIQKKAEMEKRIEFLKKQLEKENKKRR